MTGVSSSRGALIFLVGYRGTGKSTVGRLLAGRLGWAFADADDHVEQSAGKSIKEIFATAGEPAFRAQEAQAIEELSARTACVVSTGGGAVLRESTRALLKARGFVAWLTATPETVLERLRADATTGERRPNLTALSSEDEVRALIAFREPLYREVADFAVATDTLSPEAVADAILTSWNGGFTSPSCSGASPSSPSG